MKSGTNHSQGGGGGKAAGPASSDSMPVKPRQSKAAKKPGAPSASSGAGGPSSSTSSSTPIIGKGSNHHHHQSNHNPQQSAAAGAAAPDNKAGAGAKPSKGTSNGNGSANGSKAAQLDVISMGEDGYNHKAAPSLQQKVRVVPGRGEFESRYAMGRQLGLGAFSNVFLGVHKASQNNYAVKKIDREKMIWGDSRDVLEDEVNHLIMARHGPNIVQLYEVYEEKVHCYLVMELLHGGELFDRILERKNFTEANARECVRGILTGLDYLHERYVQRPTAAAMNCAWSCNQHIIVMFGRSRGSVLLCVCRRLAHRDLKPENLLLTSDESDTNVKLADFGFSKLVRKVNGCRTLCGTPGTLSDCLPCDPKIARTHSLISALFDRVHGTGNLGAMAGVRHQVRHVERGSHPVSAARRVPAL
jgi:Protein kinase domain